MCQTRILDDADPRANSLNAPVLTVLCSSFFGTHSRVLVELICHMNGARQSHMPALPRVLHVKSKVNMNLLGRILLDIDESTYPCLPLLSYSHTQATLWSQLLAMLRVPYACCVYHLDPLHTKLRSIVSHTQPAAVCA